MDINFSHFNIIDAHMHCGIQYADLGFNRLMPLLKRAGIDAAAMFPPVEEIYDRYNPHFQDVPEWIQKRQKANRYLLGLRKQGKPVFPYYFVWNDFLVSELDEAYFGIKWHRHPDEPRYNYDDPACKRFVDRIIERKLPIVLEESFENTLYFVKEIAPETTIIIPHLGALNGSFEALGKEGIWKLPNIYTDTAVADRKTIICYIETYGIERILFGSDFPFGYPDSELEKILKIGLSEEEKARILGGNLKEIFTHIQF